jgi:uncharacterized membrane protein (DUF2068 family)
VLGPDEVGMSSNKKGLKVVAVLEALKGLIALFVALSIHELAGKNIQKMLESLLGYFHLSPTSNLPAIILHNASFINNSNLTLITIAVIVYTIIRLVEAYGLWNELVWTEWFALISGGIYLPFEIYEVIVHTGVLSILVLSINIAVVWYMYSLLRGKPSSI